MQVIGVTGGIASGKSLVARRLGEHGAVVIDADLVAREVVEPGKPALEQIVQRFGDSVLAADGTLDRQALGAAVFADENARLALEQITHPAIGERVRELAEVAARENPDAIVVYDVPLLAEGAAKRTLDYDLVVVVHADRDERLRRLTQLRGMSAEEAERRIASQAGDDERLAIADVVIDANGTVEQTLRQVDSLWSRLSQT